MPLTTEQYIENTNHDEPPEVDVGPMGMSG